MWTYFFIKWLALALKNKLVGYRFGEIFSQNKDELIIGFYNDKSEEFYWILNFEASFPNMKFYDSYSRAKKNTVNLFNELLDSEIADLEPHKFERSFHITTKSGQVLILKLHGAKSNVILKTEDETILFRHNLANDIDFNLDDYLGRGFKFSQEEVESLNNFRFLDKYSKKYLIEKGYNRLSDDLKKELLLKTIEESDQDKAFLFNLNGKYQLHKLEIDKAIEIFEDPFTACNKYSSLEGSTQYLQHEKAQFEKVFSNQISKAEIAISKMTKRLEILNNSNEFEEKANLIMSNLHIFKGQSEAEIFDYYKNENRIISIKKGMSPQKFAETLYRKNKNKGIEIKNLKGSIRKAEDTYIQNKNLLKQLSSIENSKELKTWVKSENLEKKKKITEETLPFKKFIFQGYDILVGQNSKKNDTLTTQYASKNDIWMHAKDVSGSHVVIKKQGLKNVPNDVLEEAASIAAWFSKGRTDTYFPVIYTERKYVRKSKGLAAGQVKVDQHDVLIVKPKKPE